MLLVGDYDIQDLSLIRSSLEAIRNIIYLCYYKQEQKLILIIIIYVCVCVYV